MKFGGGGGGDPPKTFFRSFSSSSSNICKPDPENHGRMICKRVVSTNEYDPINGSRSEHKETEEEQRPFSIS